MALHEAQVALGEEIANAISLKTLLVKATTTIQIGDEIILSYGEDVSSAFFGHYKTTIFKIIHVSNQ